MKARIPPESAIPGCGELGRYRFRAHFDDPASAECRTTEALPAGEVVLDARLSELLCRSELVLDAAVAIGRAP